jgi:glycyl-tRNA synthetase (class II)
MLLTEEAFNDITPRYFMLRLRGMRNAQIQHYRNEWERTRWLAMFSLMPHSKKRIKPTDLARFPWETAQSIAEAVIKHLQANKETLAKLTPVVSEEGKQISLREFKKLFGQ